MTLRVGDLEPELEITLLLLLAPPLAEMLLPLPPRASMTPASFKIVLKEIANFYINCTCKYLGFHK